MVVLCCDSGCGGEWGGGLLVANLGGFV
jgi:hypothetical protein